MTKLLFHAALCLLLSGSSAFANPQPLKWAWEDANNDGVWNYSVTNWNFASANQWGNFAVSRQAYAGKTAIYFKYLNQDQVEGDTYTKAFGFALIPTADANDGTEPRSNREYNRGKNLIPYSHLEFHIKGSSGANQAALAVWLRSPNGQGSVQVPLKNYVSVNDGWQKVSIPLLDFLPHESGSNVFQLSNVHAVGFYVQQNETNVPFEFYADNLSFVFNPETSMPDIRYWWIGDQNHNGEYNYSWTRMAGDSFINTSNQWGDVAIINYLTGPYGATVFPSIDLHFHHNGTGYAEAHLTTQVANSGYEPTSEVERDAGKFIQSQQASLNFSALGFEDGGIQVRLLDKYDRASRAVKIRDYRGSYGRYAFSYSIPTESFATRDFDFTAVKSVSFFVDDKTEAGEFLLTVLTLLFKRNEGT